MVNHLLLLLLHQPLNPYYNINAIPNPVPQTPIKKSLPPKPPGTSPIYINPGGSPAWGGRGLPDLVEFHLEPNYIRTAFPPFSSPYMLFLLFATAALAARVCPTL